MSDAGLMNCVFHFQPRDCARQSSTMKHVNCSRAIFVSKNMASVSYVCCSQKLLCKHKIQSSYATMLSKCYSKQTSLSKGHKLPPRQVMVSRRMMVLWAMLTSSRHGSKQARSLRNESANIHQDHSADLNIDIYWRSRIKNIVKYCI